MKRRSPPRKKAIANKERREEIAELISPRAAKKAERRLNAHVMALDERAEEREKYTSEILAANNGSIEEVVGWMVASLRRMQGEPQLVFEGQTYNMVKGDADLLKSIQTRNFRWIAVRLLIASAEWDIQIENFRLPQDKCARCLKPKKKPRKKVSE